MAIGSASWGQCRNGRCSYTDAVGWYLRPNAAIHTSTSFGGGLDFSYRPNESWAARMGGRFHQDGTYSTPMRGAGVSAGIRYTFSDFEAMPFLDIEAGYMIGLSNGTETIGNYPFEQQLEHSLKGVSLGGGIGVEWRGLEVMAGVSLMPYRANGGIVKTFTPMPSLSIGYNIPL